MVIGAPPDGGRLLCSPVDGTSNCPEVNGWLSTIGSIDEDNDFCLGRNALQRTWLRQFGVKARETALCTAKNLFAV
jgi:hypothetical protein